ncbi:MAG: hypothetical protein RR454_04225 [Clostridia bacterium]
MKKCQKKEEKERKAKSEVKKKSQKQGIRKKCKKQNIKLRKCQNSANNKFFLQAELNLKITHTVGITTDYHKTLAF